MVFYTLLNPSNPPLTMFGRRTRDLWTYDLAPYLPSAESIGPVFPRHTQQRKMGSGWLLSLLTTLFPVDTGSPSRL